MRFFLLFIVLGLLATGVPVPGRADETDDLLKKVRGLVTKRMFKEAFSLLDKAVKDDPRNVRVRFFRGALYRTQGKSKEAIADFDAILAQNPKEAEAYNFRGAEHLKAGHVKQALADFDKYLALKPEAKKGHWMRGIALYYAGKFKEGKKQFKAYEAEDKNDVENTFWHFLCAARADGLEKARKGVLTTGKDSRVPLMEVDALIRGKAKPAEVLAAAAKVPPKSRPGLLRQQQFYGHLYLGLYYEATGDRKRSLGHIRKAAQDYYLPLYMGDIARMHLKLREKEAEKK
jgi:lipoprotein NlpI